MAVVGAGTGAAPAHLALAEEVGLHLARAGAVVLCGGLGGVMEAAARGAAAAGGLVVGILPGADRRAANPHVHVAVATGLGEARNAVLVRAADACVAVGGGWGTLSEIALARRMGKPVVALDTWRLQAPASASTGGEPEPPAGAPALPGAPRGEADPLYREAASPDEAATLALTLAGAAPPHAAPTLRATHTGGPGPSGTWTVVPAAGGAPLARHPDLSLALRSAGADLAGEVRIGRRLVMSRGVAGGRVRLDGTELAVAAVLELLAESLSAASVAGVREHYPILTEADVAACLRFAADVLAGLRLP